jgi:transcriptional regulator of acetoin/glycerol metabolism
MEVIERQHILRVLKAVNGHRTQAAKILGLDRKTLYRKLETYDQAEVELALQGSTEH